MPDARHEPARPDPPTREDRPVASERPRSVRDAVVVMRVGAATSIGAALAGATTRAQLRVALSRAAGDPTPAAVASRADDLTALAVGVGVVSAALWLIVAAACRAGRPKARVVGTVLFGLNTLNLLLGPTGAIAPGSVATKAFAVALWLVGAAATTLLWRRASAAFFRGAATPARGCRSAIRPGHPPRRLAGDVGKIDTPLSPTV